MKIKFALAACLLLVSGLATSAPIMWSQNGHYYEFVNVQVNEFEARDAATSSVFNGLNGYLATITSQQEQDFIFSLFANYSNKPRAWIGLSDAETEGVWKWLDGPEAGQVAVYTNWYSGEPNDHKSGEDYASMNWSQQGTWNDWGTPEFVVNIGYVVEYSAVSAPATIALFCIALAGFGVLRRKK